MSVVEPGSAPVCVTGASGFVGTHVVAELLARGHEVRGTVRDPDNAAKCAHLTSLPGAERLTLHRADLLEPGAFDEVVAGCGAVAHTAAVAAFTAKDPQREIVDPSVRGAANVMDAVRKDGDVRVYVQTSSMAAVSNRPQPGRVYSEDDWNDEATLETDPYGVAKREAERAMWKFAEEEGAPRCVSVNPNLVLGPVWTEAHSKTSPSVVGDLLTGTFPACPKFHFGLVDGRDVAAAHAIAMERELTGRFLLASDVLWMAEMAAVLKRRYPTRKITTRQLPNFLMYVASLFDKRVDRNMLDGLLDKELRLDTSRSREVLGLEYRTVESSLVDTAESLIAHGFA